MLVKVRELFFHVQRKEQKNVPFLLPLLSVFWLLSYNSLLLLAKPLLPPFGPNPLVSSQLSSLWFQLGSPVTTGKQQLSSSLGSHHTQWQNSRGLQRHGNRARHHLSGYREMASSIGIQSSGAHLRLLAYILHTFIGLN